MFCLVKQFGENTCALTIDLIYDMAMWIYDS